VRAATGADVEALLDVQQEGAVHGLGHIFPQEEHPFPRGALAARWRTEIEDPHVDVCVYVGDEGDIVGFAAVRGDELLHFGTAVATWGSGVASRFHDDLLDARVDVVPAPTLTLRVFEDNTRARRFYEKHGWSATGATSRSTFPPYARLLQYRRHLPSTPRQRATPRHADR
jgi:RimJ/RimL family protein N-acetyltransferase